MSRAPAISATGVHPRWCHCTACEPSCPSDLDRLDAQQFGKLTIVGMVIAHVIAAAIWGSATVLHVLVANVTGSAL